MRHIKRVLFFTFMGLASALVGSPGVLARPDKQLFQLTIRGWEDYTQYFSFEMDDSNYMRRMVWKDHEGQKTYFHKSHIDGLGSNLFKPHKRLKNRYFFAANLIDPNQYVVDLYVIADFTRKENRYYHLKLKMTWVGSNDSGRWVLHDPKVDASRCGEGLYLCEVDEIVVRPEENWAGMPKGWSGRMIAIEGFALYGNIAMMPVSTYKTHQMQEYTHPQPEKE